MKHFNLFFLISYILFTTAACSSDSNEGVELQPTLLSTESSNLTHSTEIGNFATTAIRRAYNLDFAFLPANYFADKNTILEIRRDLSPNEIETVLESFPRGPKDQLLIGTMQGEDLKNFLIQRAQETYSLDVETAGLWYDLTFDGGFLVSSRFIVDGTKELDDDQYYRIAISDEFYFGSAFPGYKYRNGFNFNFRREKYERSIQKAVKKYLTESEFVFPYWSAKRGRVRQVERPHLGFKEIHDIQGEGHTTPIQGHYVKTKGVVTAVGTDNWYPYDLDIYIQSLTPDSNPLTSEGLHLTSEFNNQLIKIGQVIEVEGYVMEEARQNGMGETTLKLSKPPEVLNKVEVLQPYNSEISNELKELKERYKQFLESLKTLEKPESKNSDKDDDSLILFKSENQKIFLEKSENLLENLNIPKPYIFPHESTNSYIKISTTLHKSLNSPKYLNEENIKQLDSKLERLVVNIDETKKKLTEILRPLNNDAGLPKAKLLRDIPTETISTFSGNLMRKKKLDLSDGIDFWESVEGMRVQVEDLVVSGFRGGGEDYIEISDRFYLNLYVYSKNSYTESLLSSQNGLIPDHQGNDYNPEIFVITTNHLSKGIEVQKSNGDYYYYNVGDEIPGSVTGVITYPKNIFGGGEYALVTPEPQKSLEYSNIETKGFVPFKQRPRSSYNKVTSNDEITVATFNLENLPGNRPDRIEVLGEVTSTNLKCPDLINLVEIQDNNGISFRESADAELTLKKVLVAVQYRCPQAHYEFIDIQPFEGAEGGQPGGNIRVAAMYNKNKLIFEHKEDPKAFGGHAVVLENGELNVNPGRVFPLDEGFRRSRRSPVMLFKLRENPKEKIYLIGAHLNSKLGDIDLWGSRQPALQISENSRAEKAKKISEFVQWIERKNPEANIIVLGDFNALEEEGSLEVLTQKETLLKNTIFSLPPEYRYTTNHNGNSQALDYIFINKNLYEKACTESEVLHLNSNYMGRISDHDPVMMKTCF